MLSKTCALAFGLLLSVIVTAASALTVTLTSNDPIFTVDFPSKWSVGEIKRGVEAKSPDEEIYLWFEVFTPAEYDALVVEHQTYFDGQGVKILGEGKAVSDAVGGMRVKVTDFPARWKGKPTVLRYLAFDFGLPSQQQVLMSYWASPEGDQAHDAAVKAIIDSMRPAR